MKMFKVECPITVCLYKLGKGGPVKFPVTGVGEVEIIYS
jgi:hypothetical protein